MSPLTLALLTLLMGVGILGFRRRADRWFGGLAIVGGLAVAVAAINGVKSDASIGLLDVGLAVVVGVVAAEAFGLPMAVAKQLGIGLRSREWEFDRAVTSILGPLNDVIAAQPPRDGVNYEEWRRGLLARVDRAVVHLNRLKAPDETWAGIASRYGDVYAEIADLYRTGDSPAKRATIASLSSALDHERQSLRETYRGSAAATIRESRMARALRAPGRGTDREDR